MPPLEPAQAVRMLDLLLAFFGDGEAWTRGTLHDGRGSRCLDGALSPDSPAPGPSSSSRGRGAGALSHEKRPAAAGPGFVEFCDDPPVRAELWQCACGCYARIS